LFGLHDELSSIFGLDFVVVIIFPDLFFWQEEFYNNVTKSFKINNKFHICYDCCGGGGSSSDHGIRVMLYFNTQLSSFSNITSQVFFFCTFCHFQFLRICNEVMVCPYKIKSSYLFFLCEMTFCYQHDGKMWKA